MQAFSFPLLNSESFPQFPEDSGSLTWERPLAGIFKHRKMDPTRIACKEQAEHRCSGDDFFSTTKKESIMPLFLLFG